MIDKDLQLASQSGMELDKAITESQLQRTVSLSVQERPEPNETSSPLPFGTLFFSKSKSLPPWWSPARDTALDIFWREVNILAGAVYAISSKLTNIPFYVVPRDPSIQSHVKEAQRLTEQFRITAEYGDGWITFFSKQVESLSTQDNGAFFEILGDGDKNGPINGLPYSIVHLDSSCCTRTGNPTYPVRYTSRRGNTRLLHHTRVGYAALQPSPREDMYGVGMCSVTRASSYAQEMLDIAIYKEEKMGSRPPRGIVLVGGGLDGERVGKSIELVRQVSQFRGNDRYVPTAVVGSPDILDPKMELINLSSLPENFDEKTATSIAINAISLGFGVDSREFWPASESGVTRADAMLSHMKSRGKGPGQILSIYKQIFETKVLPWYLKFEFDYQDDSEDRQVGEIRNTRAMTNERIMRSGAGTTRLVHQNMLRDGDIDDTQYEELELSEGRLVTGESVEVLFYSPDPTIKSLLSLGVTNPTDTFTNTAEDMLPRISQQRAEVYRVLAATNAYNEERVYRRCVAALDFLEKKYLPKEEVAVETEETRVREDYNWDENRPNRPERGEDQEGVDLRLSPNP